MREFLFLLIGLLAGPVGIAQDNYGPSEKENWVNEAQSLRAHYLSLAEGHDSIPLLISELQSLADQANLAEYQGHAHFDLANYYVAREEIYLALKSFKKAALAYEAVNDTMLQINYLSRVRAKFRAHNAYDLVAEISQKIIHLYDLKKMHQELGNEYSELGVQLFRIDKASAPRQYRLAAKHFLLAGDSAGYSRALTLYGDFKGYLGQIDSARYYYQQHQKINQRLGRIAGISGAYFKQSTLARREQNFEQALLLMDSSIYICKKSDAQFHLHIFLIERGELHLEIGNYQKAIQDCEEGKSVAISRNKPGYERKSCGCLYQAYAQIGNFEAAYSNMARFNELKTEQDASSASLEWLKRKTKLQLTQDSLQFEQARIKEEALHTQDLNKQERARNIALLVSLLTLISAYAFYNRWSYIRKAKVLIEKEKAKSDDLLLNILPTDIATELKNHGKAQAKEFEKVSILFTDFKDFTEKSATMTAIDLVNEINVCFAAFDDILLKYQVEKIKTIGDAYMAAGGLPSPSESSLKNTVLAALEMQSFISNRKAKLSKEGKSGFEMRLGIHTGPVIAGIVGHRKFQYDIWGDSVNLASRIESSGAVGLVNISQASYNLLKDDPDFKFRSRGKIRAKGKGEIEMYFVELAS